MVTVHDRTNSEKLVYLEHVEENWSAKNAIEGLSHTGDQYMEAINCLNGQFSRPRLIQQAHVRAMLDAPHVKEGTGKEIRIILKQRFRALKTAGVVTLDTFLTSMVEMMIDTDTMFGMNRWSD